MGNVFNVPEAPFNQLPIFSDQQLISYVEGVGVDFAQWTHAVLPEAFIARLADSTYYMLKNEGADESEARAIEAEIKTHYSEPIPLIRTQWGFITGRFEVFTPDDSMEWGEAVIEPDTKLAPTHRYEISVFSTTFSTKADNLNLRMALTDYLAEVLGVDSNISVTNSHELPSIAQVSVNFELADPPVPEDAVAAQDELKRFFISLVKNHRLGDIMIYGLDNAEIV